MNHEYFLKLLVKLRDGGRHEGQPLYQPFPHLFREGERPIDHPFVDSIIDYITINKFDLVTMWEECREFEWLVWLAERLNIIERQKMTFSWAEQIDSLFPNEPSIFIQYNVKMISPKTNRFIIFRQHIPASMILEHALKVRLK